MAVGADHAAVKADVHRFEGRDKFQLGGDQDVYKRQALHQLDELGVEKAYAHIPRKRGVGLAVYNRLVRSAGFQVFNPTGHHVLGLTGPTGAGKSTVGEFLKSQGCYVIDCDQVTRSAQVYDGPCLCLLYTSRCV